MEEGSDVVIDARDLALVTGQPAEFRFFSSEVRSGDAPGQIIPDAEKELLEISLLEVNLEAVEDIPAGQPVPVQINSVITEVGTLELWMKHTKSDRRWKVEFLVRTDSPSIYRATRVLGQVAHGYLMAQPKFSIGIDLGTSNSVLAYSAPKAMRKLVVALAVVLLALSALALAPGVVPTPYADILPKVTAGVAVLLLIAIFADRSKVESAGPAKKTTAPVAAPLVNQANSEVVNFLAILQERGRFVDFLMDDITAYSDAQVGAAGRVLHEGCKAVLL